MSLAANIRNSLLAGCALTAFAASPLVAQDSDEITDEPLQEEVLSTEETVPQAVPEREEPRRLFYFDGGPLRGRSALPTLGKPGMIIPVPLAPEGSIEAEATGGQRLRYGETTADLPDASNPMGLEAAPALEATIFEATSLGLLDPSTQGTAPAGTGGNTVDLWQGSSHRRAARLLGTLGSDIQSPTLRQLSRRLLNEELRLTQYEMDEEVYGLLTARLDGMAAIADREGYVALASQFPSEWDRTPLARHLATAYLLGGRHQDACQIASEQQSQDEDAFWLKLLTLCSAISGDRDTISFRIGLLEEMGDTSQSFIRMVDQILEEAASGVQGDPLVLDTPLSASVLDAWAFQLSEASLEPAAPETGEEAETAETLQASSDENAQTALLDLEKADPFGMQILLTAPGLDGASRAALAQAAANSGLPFASFYSETVEGDETGGPLARTAAAWQSALDAGHLQSATSDMRDHAVMTAPGTATAPYAGAFIRAALLERDVETAGRWWNWLRASASGSNSDMDAALLDTWPVMLLAQPDNAPDASQAIFDAWWAAQQEDPRRFESASLFLGLLSGLGMHAHDDLWALAEGGPITGGGRAVNPATWRAMMLASQTGDLAGTLTLAIKLVGESPLDEMSPAATIATIAALRTAGFEGEARSLALEAWIHRGF